MAASIPVSLEKAISALFQPSPDPAILKLLKTALGNVIREPQEMKYRSLNTSKLVTKLAASGLAPLYILRHAGFVSGETHYVLAPDASIEQVKKVLSAVVSREIGVEVEVDSTSLTNGGVGGAERGVNGEEKAPAKTSSFAGKTTPMEISASEAAEELKRHLDAEEDFKRRKEERLRVQREKQAAEEELRKVEKQVAAEKEEIKEIETEKAAAEGEIKKIEETPSADIEMSGDGDVSMSPARVHLPSEQTPSVVQCPHCSLENEGGISDCAACGLPLPSSSSTSSSSVSSSSSSKPSQVSQAVAEGELDEEMLAIIQGMKKEDQSTGGIEGEEGKKLSDMTLEEKLAWVENAKVQNKKKKEAAAIAKEKESERNRVSLAKAAMDLQEKQEQYAIKMAQDTKKREEKEKKLARERIKAKIAEHKRERQSEQEAEAREKARQEALLATQKNSSGQK